MAEKHDKRYANNRAYRRMRKAKKQAEGEYTECRKCDKKLTDTNMHGYCSKKCIFEACGESDVAVCQGCGQSFEKQRITDKHCGPQCKELERVRQKREEREKKERELLSGYLGEKIGDDKAMDNGKEAPVIMVDDWNGIVMITPPEGHTIDEEKVTNGIIDGDQQLVDDMVNEIFEDISNPQVANTDWKAEPIDPPADRKPELKPVPQPNVPKELPPAPSHPEKSFKPKPNVLIPNKTFVFKENTDRYKPHRKEYL